MWNMITTLHEEEFEQLSDVLRVLNVFHQNKHIFNIFLKTNATSQILLRRH